MSDLSRLAPTNEDPPARQAVQRLKREMIAIVLGQIVAATAMLWILARFWPRPLLALWALVTTGALLHIWSLTWRQLPSHRPAANKPLLDTLGPGNILSLVRAWLLAAVAGFILTPWPPATWAWLPAAFFTLAVILGYAARKSGTHSALGEFLDMELDGLGMLIGVSVAIHLGTLPVWFIVVGLARYVFSTGLHWRERRQLPIRALGPSKLRRILAGMQMGFLSVALWPIVDIRIMGVVGLVFAVPYLVVFGRDWLVVSARLELDSPTYTRWQAAAQRVFMGGMPLVARVIGGLALITVLWQEISQFDSTVAAFAAAGYPAAAWLLGLFVLIQMVGLPLLALGVAGRVVALALLVPLGFTTLTSIAGPAHILALLACVYVLVFGSGQRALWQPEEAWLQSRAGES